MLRKPLRVLGRTQKVQKKLQELTKNNLKRISVKTGRNFAEILVKSEDEVWICWENVTNNVGEILKKIWRRATYASPLKFFF